MQNIDFSFFFSCFSRFLNLRPSMLFMIHSPFYFKTSSSPTWITWLGPIAPFRLHRVYLMFNHVLIYIVCFLVFLRSVCFIGPNRCKNLLIFISTSLSSTYEILLLFMSLDGHLNVRFVQLSSELLPILCHSLYFLTDFSFSSHDVFPSYTRPSCFSLCSNL